MKGCSIKITLLILMSTAFYLMPFMKESQGEEAAPPRSDLSGG